MSPRKLALFASILSLLSAATGSIRADDVASAPTPRQIEHFERKIRPVLVEHCYKCHSSESRKVRGGLLLDSREGWKEGGDTGPALVPGSPESSLLLSALRYEDLEMPPKRKLSDEIIRDFEVWIRDGAADPRTKSRSRQPEQGVFDLDERRSWWSFQPVVARDPPRVNTDHRIRDPIDRFVLEKLDARGWKPAPESSPRAWLRRVTYDLTGLPPEPAAVRAFLADLEKAQANPEAAYARVVDRLLSSPHFGEQWARHWMDLVRFAESKAFEADYLMANVHRYRDYLIRAFGRDVPYDQFVLESLAGDLLETPRLDPETGENESIHGPGFIYLTDGQHGPPDIHADEARIFEGMIDVVGKAFLGLTVACSRCHDHKFDALTTGDYYSLYGVIASSRLDYACVNPPAKLDALEERLAAEKERVRAALSEVLAEDLEHVEDDLAAARSGKPSSERSKRWADALTKKPNDELRALADLLEASDSDAIENTRKRILAGARAAESGLGQARDARDSFGEWIPSGRAFQDRPSAPGDFIVTPDGERVVASFAGGHAAAGNLSSRLAGAYRSPSFDVGRQVSVRVKGKNVRVSLIIRHYELVGRGPTTGGLTKVINSDTWQTVSFNTYLWEGLRGYLEVVQNGGELRFAATTGNHVDGSYAVVGAAHATSANPPARPAGLAFFDEKALAAATANDPASLRELVAGRLRSLPTKWREGTLTTAEGDLLDGLLEAGVLVFDRNRSEKLRVAVDAYRKALADVPKPKYVRTLADGNGEDEPIYIRGSHTSPSPKANPRRFLDAIDGKPFEGPGSGRLAWARALVAKDNPLTARVMSNRIWHHLFGRGLVYSVDDFGHMGTPPTHPELLDYLATEFVEGGWSVQKLIRRLVLSSTYRRSSVASKEALELDPTNELLQHMPIRRLPAESIRDTLLTLGGSLQPNIFGQSVGANSRDRRSVYVQLRRRHMPEFLMLFDMPDANEPFGRRNVTNSPSQSLELLNGDLAWFAADAWAKRLLGGPEEPFDARIDRLHREAFARPATERELEWARGLLSDLGADIETVGKNHAVWKSICHTMINRKELIYVY